MGLEFVYSAPGCGEVDARPLIVSGLQYMYFAVLLFWLTIAITVGLSLATQPVKSFRVRDRKFPIRLSMGRDLS